MTDSAEQIGNCRLCGQRTKLCLSHIVPEFCYKQLYDPKHQIKQLNLKKHGVPKHILIKKGIREHLLCKHCEALISRYEGTFKTFWYDCPGIPAKVDPGANGIIIDGLDYASTKLFHLSILWRASASRWGRNVSLGPRYTQKIGQMLLTADPGPTEHFPILGTLLVDNKGNVFHGIITEPVRSRVEHSHVYFMCYAGCDWNFCVTDHPTLTETQIAKAMDSSGRITLMCCKWFDSNTAQIMRKYPQRK